MKHTRSISRMVPCVAFEVHQTPTLDILEVILTGILQIARAIVPVIQGKNSES